ncbi:MAG: LeuD/DmdB family oxidoreductase small subunit [Pseudomonadota bacterium]
MTVASGRAFVYGDNVDTDMLAPGLYMKQPIEVIAKHCLEALDPDFAQRVQPGDIIVGGENFGIGSSREQAVLALRHLGLAAIVAKSFAGLFFRNALNLGLAALVCPAAGRIRAGEHVMVTPEAGRIDNLSTGESYVAEPIPPHLVEMIRDGGLLPHLEKKLKGGRP